MSWFFDLFRPREPDGPETTSAAMRAALKACVIPRLRAMGFKGSLPHFRRERGDAWDILTFTFSTSGGRFAVEIARWPDSEIESAGKLVGPDKATSFHAWYRHRLGAEAPRGNRPRTHHWFDFERTDAEAVAAEVLAQLEDERQWEIVDRLPVERGDGSGGGGPGTD